MFVLCAGMSFLGAHQSLFHYMEVQFIMIIITMLEEKVTAILLLCLLIVITYMELIRSASPTHFKYLYFAPNRQENES